MPDVAMSSFVSVHVSVTLLQHLYTADLHVFLLYINLRTILLPTGLQCWIKTAGTGEHC